MRTANPTLNDQVFANAPATVGGQVMTLQGAVNKTFILALLLVISGGFSWQFVQANPQLSGMLSIGSALLGFILVLASLKNARKLETGYKNRGKGQGKKATLGKRVRGWRSRWRRRH